MNRPKCTGCAKPISGKINIETRARKLGGKVIHDVLYYCKLCFYKINMERSWNVYRKEEAARKRKNNR